MEEVRSGHDEEQEAPPPSGGAAEPVWDDRMDTFGQEYETAVLSLVAPDGFPFSVRVPVSVDRGANRVHITDTPLGLPLQPGLACLAAHDHDPDFTWQRNFHVRGDLVEDDGRWSVMPRKLVGGFELPPGGVVGRIKRTCRRSAASGRPQNASSPSEADLPRGGQPSPPARRSPACRRSTCARTSSRSIHAAGTCDAPNRAPSSAPATAPFAAASPPTLTAHSTPALEGVGGEVGGERHRYRRDDRARIGRGAVLATAVTPAIAGSTTSCEAVVDVERVLKRVRQRARPGGDEQPDRPVEQQRRLAGQRIELGQRGVGDGRVPHALGMACERDRDRQAAGQRRGAATARGDGRRGRVGVRAGRYPPQHLVSRRVEPLRLRAVPRHIRRQRVVGVEPAARYQRVGQPERHLRPARAAAQVVADGVPEQRSEGLVGIDQADYRPKP